MEEHGVVHKAVMNKTMDEFEEEELEWDLNCPLLFRPFIFKLLERLRQRLDDQKTYEFLLEDVPQGQASQILPLGHGRGLPCQAQTPPQSLDGAARVRYPGVLKNKRPLSSMCVPCVSGITAFELTSLIRSFISFKYTA